MEVEDGYVLTASDYPSGTGMSYITWEQYTSPIHSDITINGSYSWGGMNADDNAELAGSGEGGGETAEITATASTTTTVTDTDYIYNGSQLTGEVITTTVDGSVTNTETLYYSYDASGTPVSVKYNNTLYFYVTNLQCDVVAIMNSSGTIVVEYTYDAWGYIRNTTGSLRDTLGKSNALRYRGYDYDRETALYYLQSRYYNPGTGRFINADVLVSTGQGLLGNNMYTYCLNNPIVFSDSTGTMCAMSWVDLGELISGFLHDINNVAKEKGLDTAGVGAALLGFYESEPGVYHAKTNCWQRHFGYNRLYDAVFDIATSMMTAQFEFSHNGTSYVIWVWKGDYINLGAGTELGIYYGGGPQWSVDVSLSMNMSLSLSYKGSTIATHSQKTRWITAFNSNYLNVQASDLMVKYTIYFNSPGMYNSFAAVWNGKSGWVCNPNNHSATLGF